MKNFERPEIGTKKSKKPVDSGKEKQEQTSFKILIVDDQAGLYSFGRNKNVILAENTTEAEQHLKSGGFDVVLLDGHLDQNDVFENGPDALTHWIEEGVSLPPVFMMSADEKMQQKGIEAGAKGAIKKSLLHSGDIAEIEKAVKAL